MEKPLALSMWIAVALYAVCGLFGIVVFHDALPNTQQLTDGYGVNYRTTAALPTRNNALPILKISGE